MPGESKNKIDIDTPIELRSEEFQEILGSVPSWILRRGITLLAVIIAILLIGSAVFKYPDSISTSMTLTGSTPAASTIARTSGKIQELNIRDEQAVKTGDYLAVIENPANTEDILLLKAYLGRVSLDGDTMISLLPEHLQLGTLQSDYAAFYLTLSEYSQYRRLRYYLTKTGIIHERISQYETQLENLIRQKKVTSDQLLLIKSKYQRDSLLNRKGILSDEEFENTKSQYLQGILSYENITSSVDNNRIQIGQMQESLFETGHQDIEKENTLKSRLKTLITQLQSGIQAWELTHVLISPIDGRVTFTNYWVANQNVTAGEVIFNIVPEETGQVMGKAQMPLPRSGKVKSGQRVNIRLANFPDHEYGIIKGKVKNISLVPARNTQGETYYTVEIELPEGLTTTYRKQLPYLPEMQAQADIITEDISLLERLFMPIRKIWKEGVEDK